MPYREDPRLQPPEPKIYGMCDYCQEEIELGECIAVTDIGIVHDDCFDDFVKDRLNVKRETAEGE